MPAVIVPRRDRSADQSGASRHMPIRIDLVPVRTRPGYYDALLAGRILCRSRQPFYDAARVLLNDGIDYEIVIEAWHRGSPHPAMRAPIGEASNWAIEETERTGFRRRRWRPFAESRMGRPSASSLGDGVDKDEHLHPMGGTGPRPMRADRAEEGRAAETIAHRSMKAG